MSEGKGAAGWDTYWQGAQHGAAYPGGGSTHPAILSFWDRSFAELDAGRTAIRIVDVASGNGALAERARTAFGERAQLVCLDVSEAAVRGLAKRFAAAACIVADARRIPLESGTADLVVSQFGVEYAGTGAVMEAQRLVASGGAFLLLLHHRHGGIYRQCAASLAAVRELQAAEFIPRALDLFETGFAAMRGEDRGRYETAAKNMRPAVHAAESVMRRYGRQVADNTVVRLYQDVKTMHERMPNYDAADVLGWLAGMRDELAAYVGRMASMCDAAIDESEFQALCAELRQLGFELPRAEPLINPQSGVPLAWSLVARRP